MMFRKVFWTKIFPKWEARGAQRGARKAPKIKGNWGTPPRSAPDTKMEPKAAQRDPKWSQRPTAVVKNGGKGCHEYDSNAPKSKQNEDTIVTEPEVLRTPFGAKTVTPSFVFSLIKKWSKINPFSESVNLWFLQTVPCVSSKIYIKRHPEISK